MPFQVPVRFWMIAAKPPEWTCVLWTEIVGGPNGDQPEASPVSKPGFGARFCAAAMQQAQSQRIQPRPKRAGGDAPRRHRRAISVTNLKTFAFYSAGAGLCTRKNALEDFTLFESASTVGNAALGINRQVAGPTFCS